MGLSLANRLALERTRMAQECTLTAWVRTGISLITFGFAVYKFFELKIASINLREGLVTTAMIEPREFGLVLIGIGLLSVLIGTIEHGRHTSWLCISTIPAQTARQTLPDAPVSLMKAKKRSPVGLRLRLKTQSFE